MRIAFVTTMNGYPWAGSEELWAAAAQAALKAGDAVLASVYGWPELPPRLSGLQQQGAVLHFRSRHEPRNRLTRAWARIADVFREVLAFRPDVVCISQGATYDCVRSPQLMKLLHKLREAAIPYVLICENVNNWHFFDDAQLATARELLSSAARIGFLFDEHPRICRRQLAMELTNAMIVRNPVNLRDTSAVAWPDGETPLRMAHVGRLDVWDKAQDLLLDVLHEGPWRERDWRLTMFGTGTNERLVNDLIRMFRLEDRVTLAGQVANVRAIWRDHHALVMPSYQEGVPLAFVEASLCGRAALLTDVGGNAEWVVHGTTGFLAAAANRQQVSAAMEELWAARWRLRALGEAARAYVSARVDAHPGRTLLNTLHQVGARDASTLIDHALARV